MVAIVLCMPRESLMWFFSIPIRISRTLQIFNQKIGGDNGKSVAFDTRTTGSVYTLFENLINFGKWYVAPSSNVKGLNNSNFLTQYKTQTFGQSRQTN